MKSPLSFLFWLVLLGGLLNYFLSSSSVTVEAENKMKEAYIDYKRGENAKTVGERKILFNQALSLYSQLEKEYHPEFGNGKLYFDIANCYFQTGEYSWAALYYYRALKLMPRNEKLKHNLAITYEKLGFAEEEKSSIFNQVFFFYTSLSLPEKLQTAALLSTITFIFLSIFIWQRKVWSKSAAIVTGLLTAILVLMLGYHFYMSPMEAVLVRSSSLYRDAGYQYAKVIDEPILSGKKVEVLDVMKGGEWLKILTPNGKLGYVPQESVRII